MEKLAKMVVNKEKHFLQTLAYPDYCLKCAKRIKPPLEVVTIEYVTNKPTTINLHKNCYKGKLNPSEKLSINS